MYVRVQDLNDLYLVCFRGINSVVRSCYHAGARFLSALPIWYDLCDMYTQVHVTVCSICVYQVLYIVIVGVPGKYDDVGGALS